MARFLAAAGPLLGRWLLSLIFLVAGYQKFAFPGRAARLIVGRGLPFATPGVYAGGAFELAMGVLLVLGLKARAAAVATVLYLAVVTWLFHWHGAMRGDAAQMQQVLKNLGVAGGLLLLASFGPGPASIDRG